MPLVTCPKHGCGWTVDPASVPAGNVVTCPKCGQRFKLATAAPSRGDGRWSSLLVVFGVALVVALLAGAISIVVTARKALQEAAREDSHSPVLRDADRNFTFTPPGGDWSPDTDTRNTLGVNVTALHRPAPEAWAALAVKDFGNRPPLESELRGQMVVTLGKLFNNLPPEPAVEPTTWAGQPAVVWRFRGEHGTTGAVCGGEAVAMTYKGVGYWFYGWAAERDYDSADAEKVRAGFRLLDGRAGWAPTAANEVTFRGPASGYTLTAYEKIWEPVPSPGDGTDLELRGTVRGRGKRDFPPRAEVRVWRRAEAGEPAAVADALVRKEFTRDAETFGKSEFAELTEPPAGDAPPGPDAPPATPVRRLSVAYGSDEGGRAKKLLAVAVVRAGDAVMVAVAACPWDEREVWERRFVQLLGSLR